MNNGIMAHTTMANAQGWWAVHIFGFLFSVTAPPASPFAGMAIGIWWLPACS